MQDAPAIFTTNHRPHEVRVTEAFACIEGARGINNFRVKNTSVTGVPDLPPYLSGPWADMNACNIGLHLLQTAGECVGHLPESSRMHAATQPRCCTCMAVLCCWRDS